MASVTASYVRQLFLAMDANSDSEVTSHELLEFLRKHKPKHGPYSSLAKVHRALGMDVLGHRVDWTAFEQAFHKSGMVAEEFEFNFAELPKGAKHVGGRPVGAVGTFLRIVTVNDVYTLKNYPMMATAVELARSQMAELDCVVSSHNNGDWMSPCLLSSIDGGAGMVEGLNYGKIDRVCLGNHEFDKGFDALKSKMRTYKGVLLNSNITGPPSFLAELPKYDAMEVGEKTVLFTGVCVGTRALYKPSATPTVVKVHDAIPQVWSEAKKALGRTPDAHIPMTHQVIADDRTTASMLAAHPELGSRTPCILGGHDHEEFVEVADGVHIVKVGQNAEKIGFVDVWWAADGSLHCQSKSVPATEFKKEAEAESFYQRKQNLMSTMMELPIAVCPAGTTKRVRFEESTTVKWLLGMIKRAKKDEGVEMCINLGGNIRGKADYTEGEFTMGNLYAEFGFETRQAVVQLPGRIIQESIHRTRESEGSMTREGGAKPSFLHCDDECVLDSSNNLLVVDGKPFDSSKMYTVSIYVAMLTGLGEVQPLLDYTKENVQVPDEEMCDEAKEVIVHYLVRVAWGNLLGMDRWDLDNDGHISESEMERGINRAFAELDKNGDGMIHEAELRAFVLEHPSAHVSLKMVHTMFEDLDANADGMISKDELKQLCI